MRRFHRPQVPVSAGAVFYRLAARLQRLAPLPPVLPFDAVRVQEIRRALREGRFSVNAELVAERFTQRLRGLATVSASRPDTD